MARIIGLLGGSFDPIHHGHLRLALECAAEVGFTETRLIPAAQSPHRTPPIASAAQRLRMVELALAGDAGLCAEDSEIRRGGISYTIDTLAALRRDTTKDSLCLILGQDVFLKLPTWRRWEQLLEHAHIVVAARPGQGAATPDPALRGLIERHGVSDATALRRRETGCILQITIPALDISSTGIRHAIAAGESVRYLTPEPVIQYIQQEALYRNQK